MASVQVRILQSGRSDEYGLPLTPGSVATVDRDYAVSLVSTGFASWVNLADAYDGETNLGKPSETYDLWQSGLLFAIFAGDGGANGFAFSGTAGQFTLSAAPLTNIWNLFKAPAGGYCYLPPGAGGLASGGLYFFRMTSDTTGEVYQEKYTPGSGKPTIPSSPTPHSNLAAGRITQSTSEIVVASFPMPGNSMGENGLFRALIASKCESNAAARTFRVRVGSIAWASLGLTTSNTVMDFETVAQNQGVPSQQVITRLDSRISSGSISLFTDYTSVDTSVDGTVQFSMQTASSTASCIGMLRECVVKYSGV